MSDEESDGEEPQWLLGFVDDAEPSSLRRHHFPCKVGGCPAWLDPMHLPSSEELECGVSGRPLDFLLQVYATPPALDHIPDAFHRTIFLFISPQGDQLHRRGAVKAFRSQLPRINSHYGPEPAAEGSPACLNLEAELQDGRRDYPADRWQVAQAEAAAAKKHLTAGPTLPFMYPEMALIVEPEAQNGGSNNLTDDVQTDRLIREYHDREITQGTYTAEDLPPEVVSTLEQHSSVDTRQFADFAAAVASAPEQVLRYCFEPEAVPLWPSFEGVPSAADIPECTACGSPRQFEFQVLPQLLNHLGIDAEATHAPDWGVIAVYSCSRSCRIEGYHEEFVWVQPIT